MLRLRAVVVLSLGFQLLWAFLAWRWDGFATATYPLILPLLPGLVLMWFVLSPAFVVGAPLIAGINVAYHVGLLALWHWWRERRAAPAPP